jgi:DNA-binding NtrC family response regulator
MTDGDAAGDRPVVLAVDDHERVAKSFEIWLSDEYDVRTALDGEAALAAVDDSVDVVLLDRHMPGRSGDEVLEAIRERGLDCRVAMVTGVDPDFDIVEMPFDEYVQKPLDESALRETVERLVELSEFDEGIEELYALSQKRATLEAEKSRTELERNADYAALCDRQEELAARLDETAGAVETEGLAAMLPDGQQTEDL